MPLSVLIVDDHPSFRSSARMLLESEGYRVVGEADDGEGAVAAVRDLAPDVVLLDVQLPGMDGFEVSAQLTANGDPPAVVMVSSRDGCDYGTLAFDNGARGFIPKSELSAAALEEALG